MFRITFLLMSSFTLLECQNIEPRQPISKQMQVFLNESAKRNKNIIAIEQSLFSKVIHQEEKLSFESSPQGFWFAYQKKHL